MKGRSINCPYCYAENRDINIEGGSAVITCCNCGREIYVAVSKRYVKKPVRKSFLSSLMVSLFGTDYRKTAS